MEHPVCSYDVDIHGEVKCSALVRFMQETALHHAEHLDLGSSRLAAGNMAWVLVRQRFRLSALPRMGDVVTVATWPSGADRLFFYRDFRITGPGGSQVLEATTSWFVIDLEERRRRHPDAYFESELPLGAPLFDTRPARLKAFEPEAAGPATPAGYSDLDINGHVNNVRYLEWLFDGLPVGFHWQQRLRECELNYLAEAVGGDEVRAEYRQTSPGEFIHRILKTAGGKELLRARTIWEPGRR